MTKTHLSSIALTACLSISLAQASTFSDVSPGNLHSATGESADYDMSDSTHYLFDFYFELASVSTLLVSASLTTLNNISADTHTLTLYSYSPNVDFNDQTLGTLGSFTYATDRTDYYFTAVVIGSYFYEVTGSNQGPGAIMGNFQSNIVAVPEPQIYGLLVAGLGLIGGRARHGSARRQRV